MLSWNEQSKHMATLRDRIMAQLRIHHQHRLRAVDSADEDQRRSVAEHILQSVLPLQEHFTGFEELVSQGLAACACGGLGPGPQ